MKGDTLVKQPTTDLGSRVSAAQQSRIRAQDLLPRHDWDEKRKALIESGLVAERSAMRPRVDFEVEDMTLDRDPNLLLPGSSVEHVIVSSGAE